MWLKVNTVVVVLLLLISRSRCERYHSSECPSNLARSATLLPDDSDCQNYFACTHGQKIPMRCPKGLYFNPKYQVCDYPQNVHCEVKQCPPNNVKGKSVLLPDPHNCNRFFMCDNGKKVRMSCPPTLHFDRRKQICNYPTYANCKDTRNEISSHQAINKNTKCSDFGAYIGHKYDCSKFYVCAHGALHELKCPGGLHFDSRINTCNWPNHAQCRKTIHYHDEESSDQDKVQIVLEDDYSETETTEELITSEVIQNKETTATDEFNSFGYSTERSETEIREQSQLISTQNLATSTIQTSTTRRYDNVQTVLEDEYSGPEETKDTKEIVNDEETTAADEFSSSGYTTEQSESETREQSQLISTQNPPTSTIQTSSTQKYEPTKEVKPVGTNNNNNQKGTTKIPTTHLHTSVNTLPIVSSTTRTTSKQPPSKDKESLIGGNKDTTTKPTTHLNTNQNTSRPTSPLTSTTIKPTASKDKESFLESILNQMQEFFEIEDDSDEYEYEHEDQVLFPRLRIQPVPRNRLKTFLRHLIEEIRQNITTELKNDHIDNSNNNNQHLQDEKVITEVNITSDSYELIKRTNRMEEKIEDSAVTETNDVRNNEHKNTFDSGDTTELSYSSSSEKTVMQNKRDDQIKTSPPPNWQPNLDIETSTTPLINEVTDTVITTTNIQDTNNDLITTMNKSFNHFKELLQTDLLPALKAANFTEGDDYERILGMINNSDLKVTSTPLHKEKITQFEDEQIISQSDNQIENETSSPETTIHSLSEEELQTSSIFTDETSLPTTELKDNNKTIANTNNENTEENPKQYVNNYQNILISENEPENTTTILKSTLTEDMNPERNQQNTESIISRSLENFTAVEKIENQITLNSGNTIKQEKPIIENSNAKLEEHTISKNLSMLSLESQDENHDEIVKKENDDSQPTSSTEELYNVEITM